MKRILVIGTSGAGKSTLAKRISEKIGLPFFASDQFYWLANWEKTSSQDVQRKIRQVVDQDAWVLDGNFDDERELVWTRADCIVWLDYPLATIVLQVSERNLRWFLTGQPTWSDNRMGLSRALSGIHHTLKSHRIKKHNYPLWLKEVPGVIVHHFCCRQEADAWLQTL